MGVERATHSDRERAASRLRSGWLKGAVSTDTFESRLELVLDATDQSQLRTLTHDLPGRWHSLRRLPTRLQRVRRSRDPVVLVLRCNSEEDEITLGRHRSCSRVFDDESVSRHHARIKRSSSGLRIADLESTNGTFVNGKRVTVSARIAHGDRVQLGRLHFVISDH